MGHRFSRTAAPDDAVRPAASPTRWPSAVERYEGWLTKLSVSSWWIFKNWRRRYLVVSAGVVRWQRTDEPDAPASGSLLLDGFTRVERKDGRLTVHARRDGDAGNQLQELVLDAADEDGGAAWETTIRQARRVRLAGEPPPDAEVEIEEGTAPTPRERQRAARQKLGELAGFALEQSTKLTPTDEGFTVQTGEQSIECTVAEDDGDGRHTSHWEGRRDQWMAVVAAAAWGGGPRGPTSAASSAAPSAASSNSMLAGSAREW